MHFFRGQGRNIYMQENRKTKHNIFKLLDKKIQEKIAKEFEQTYCFTKILFSGKNLVLQ